MNPGFLLESILPITIAFQVVQRLKHSPEALTVNLKVRLIPAFSC